MRTRAALIAATTTLALAGCAGSQGAGSTATSTGAAGSDVKSTFLNAYNSASTGTEASSTLRFETTPGDVAKILELADVKDEKTIDLVSKGVAGTTVTVAMKSTNGKPLSENSDLFGMDLNYVVDMSKVEGGTDNAKVEFVFKDGALFARADVKPIMTRVGQSAAVAEVDKFIAQAPAQFLKDGLEGKWLTLDKGLVEQFKTQYQKSTASASASISPQDIRKLQDAMREALTTNSTFTDGGTSDQGQLIKVEVQAKPFLKAAVNGVMDALPAATKASITSSATPTLKDSDLKALKDDAKFTVESYVKDGSVTRMSVDLAQLKSMMDFSQMSLSPDMVTKIGNLTYQGKLIIDSSKTATIEAPTGATTVTQADIEKLTGRPSSTSSL